MRRFTIRYPCAIEPERYWREVFFNPEYTENLWHEAYHVHMYELVEETVTPDGGRTRRARIMPKIDAPPALRKRIGDSTALVEIGRLEIEGPDAPRWVARLLTPRAAEISIVIVIRLEPTGPGQSDWLVEVELASSSREALEFAERTLRDRYQRAAEFTARWVRERTDPLTNLSSRVQPGVPGAFLRLKPMASHS